MRILRSLRRRFNATPVKRPPNDPPTITMFLGFAGAIVTCCKSTNAVGKIVKMELLARHVGRYMLSFEVTMICSRMRRCITFDDMVDVFRQPDTSAVE